MNENPLSALKIDYWYKLLPVIGLATLVVGLTVEVKEVSNILVQLVSIGVILIGIGEWINHPLQTRLGPGGFKITSYNRLNTLAGNLWVLAGIFLIAYAAAYHS
jgi:hypothetical protein